jgi:hypothetical protein
LQAIPLKIAKFIGLNVFKFAGHLKWILSCT